MQFDLEMFVDGIWHPGASVTLEDTSAGYLGPASVEYDLTYFADMAAQDYARSGPVHDIRAVSVRNPVDLVTRHTGRWPAFLMDLMPQGHARRKLAQNMGLDERMRASDLPLLLRAAGSPIGNIRIAQAEQAERERLDGVARIGVTLDEILAKTERFLEVVDRFSMLASGSSGLQGEWPKVAMTQATDGLYYPDPLVGDGEAMRHVIVKLLRSDKASDGAILLAEAVYSRISAEIGLNVMEPSVHGDGVLVIPRFDRATRVGGTVRFGQESLVSALGVAEFGYVTTHEAYLDVLKRTSSRVFEDVSEYVRREIANQALGNTDNHGRNSALSKYADGTIRLSPLYDFAPMKLAQETVVRSTRWDCMRKFGRDHLPDWRIVAESVFPDSGDADRLLEELADFAGRLQAAPGLARQMGLGDDVIVRAMARHDEIVGSLSEHRSHGHGV